MKNQIATTPEQSKRLRACGVSPKTADFFWIDDSPDKPRLTIRTDLISPDNPYIIAPAWSLPALLSLMPQEINGVKQTAWIPRKKKMYKIHRDGPSIDGWLSICQYDRGWFFSYGFHGVSPHNKSIIEAAVRMIEFLTANGVKLNRHTKVKIPSLPSLSASEVHKRLSDEKDIADALLQILEEVNSDKDSKERNI